MKKEILVVALCGLMAGCNGGGNVENAKSDAGKDSVESVKKESEACVAPIEKNEEVKKVRIVEMKGLNEKARRYGMNMAGFYCGRAAAGIGKKWGYVDMEGEMVIGAGYGSCMYNKFNDGFASVSKDGKEGVIDTMGRVVVPFEYENICVSDGMAVMKKGDVYSVCDLRSGKTTEMEGYSEVMEFSEGMAIVETDEWNGYMDRRLNVVAKVGKGDWCNGFSEGVAVVRSEVGDYYVDKKGVKRYAPKGYKLYGGFRTGVTMFESGGKFGLIDKEFKVVAEAKYKEIAVIDYVGEGESDILPYAVREGNRWYVMDKEKSVVAEIVWDRGFEYDNEGIAYDGESIIINANESYLFNRKGERMFAKEYEEFWYVAKGLYAVRKGKKWGVIDLNGEVVVPLEYDRYECLDKSGDGIVRFKKGEEYRFFRVKS